MYYLTEYQALKRLGYVLLFGVDIRQGTNNSFWKSLLKYHLIHDCLVFLLRLLYELLNLVFLFFNFLCFLLLVYLLLHLLYSLNTCLQIHFLFHRLPFDLINYAHKFLWFLTVSTYDLYLHLHFPLSISYLLILLFFINLNLKMLHLCFIYDFHLFLDIDFHHNFHKNHQYAIRYLNF